MKNYTAPSVEEIKLVAMEHVTAGGTGVGGNTGTGGAGYGRPGA